MKKVLIFLFDIAVANLTVYCENYDNNKILTYGGLTEYQRCEGLCECFVFELLCLERDKDASNGYKLLSRSY